MRTGFATSKNLSKSGLTLIEVLVVVAIMAVLAIIALPILGDVRMKALRSETTNNLRQLGVSLHSYISENNNRLPIGYQTGNPIAGREYGTWVHQLERGGFLGDTEGPLLPGDSSVDQYRILSSPIQRLSHPEYSGGSYSTRLRTFSGNSGVLVNSFNNWTNPPRLLSQFVQPSLTMVISEGTANDGEGAFNAVMYPQNPVTYPDYLHSGMISVLFLDGHVETIHESDTRFMEGPLTRGSDKRWFWLGIP